MAGAAVWWMSLKYRIVRKSSVKLYILNYLAVINYYMKLYFHAANDVVVLKCTPRVSSTRFYVLVQNRSHRPANHEQVGTLTSEALFAAALPRVVTRVACFRKKLYNFIFSTLYYARLSYAILL